MFEIIMYLFENYIQAQILPAPEADELVDELELAGFKKTEIQKAFAWFAGLNKTHEGNIWFKKQAHQNIRFYIPEEKRKLGRRCLGLLAYLEQIGIITPELRETIIDRAMAIENSRIEFEELKWIVLMVLFHNLDKSQDIKSDLTWIENLLFTDLETQTVH